MGFYDGPYFPCFPGLFSKIRLLRVFHSSHTVNPGRSSHSLLTILFLNTFMGHFSNVMSSLPLCWWFLKKMVAPFYHMESTTGHSSRRWLIDSLFPLHMQHLEGPLIPLVCNLSQVRMRHLSMSQQKAATFGHHPPPHIFPHLASRSRFWVPVTRARACLGLKFPVLDYPHLSLFGLSFLVIFLELSSAMKSSAFSSGAFDLHQLLSFQDLKIQSLSLGS